MRQTWMAAFVLYLLCSITDIPLKDAGHGRAAGASSCFGMRRANDSGIAIYAVSPIQATISLKERKNIAGLQQLDPVHVAVAEGCAARLTAARMQLLPRWPAFEEATERSTSQVMPQLEI